MLCIDNEPRIRQLLCDDLTHFDHQVTVASTGIEGLKLFHAAGKEKQSREVVITDMDLDGHKVAKTIKSESADTTVIIQEAGFPFLKLKFNLWLDILEKLDIKNFYNPVRVIDTNRASRIQLP